MKQERKNTPNISATELMFHTLFFSHIIDFGSCLKKKEKSILGQNKKKYVNKITGTV